MTILVDAAIWARHGTHWCHVVSDVSLDELHAFAAAVGLPRRAFERDHYDVPAARRDAVIASGAVPVTSRELLARLSAAGLRRRRLARG